MLILLTNPLTQYDILQCSRPTPGNKFSADGLQFIASQCSTNTCLLQSLSASYTPSMPFKLPLCLLHPFHAFFIPSLFSAHSYHFPYSLCFLHPLIVFYTLPLPSSLPHWHPLSALYTPSMPSALQFLYAHPHYLLHSLSAFCTPSMPSTFLHCLIHTLIIHTFAF